MTPWRGFVEPTLAQRVLARLIDSAVLFPVVLLVGFVAEGRIRTATGMALSAAYEIVAVAARGQTVGKVVMATKVVDAASGTVPTVSHAMLRWLVLIAGSLLALAVPVVAPFDVIYTIVVLLPILRPPFHRGVHDTAARTVVTSLRPAAAPV